MTYQGAVVVAIGEDEPNMVLLSWAAAEAGWRRTALVVCHICEWRAGHDLPRPMDDGGSPEPRVGPERVVGQALDAVRAEFPGLAVSGAIGAGNPVPALLTVSETAGMVVLGARGTGGFPGLLIGSVSAQLAAHGHCPVAVVRPAGTATTDVVVGIDGSQASGQALALALAEARRTGGTLVAVHAHQVPPVAAAYSPNPGFEPVRHRDLAVETLDAALGTVEADNPDVKVERRVEHGPAARVLLDRAGDAAALVVGARGRGGFAGLVLGSVSQQVMRHAPCPVLIAR